MLHKGKNDMRQYWKSGIITIEISEDITTIAL